MLLGRGFKGRSPGWPLLRTFEARPVGSLTAAGFQLFASQPSKQVVTNEVLQQSLQSLEHKFEQKFEQFEHKFEQFELSIANLGKDNEHKLELLNVNLSSRIELAIANLGKENDRLINKAICENERVEQRLAAEAKLLEQRLAAEAKQARFDNEKVAQGLAAEAKLLEQRMTGEIKQALVISAALSLIVVILSANEGSILRNVLGALMSWLLGRGGR
jgi:hypothetical protein